MIDLSGREEVSYGDIADRLTAEIGSKSLPTVVEAKFNGAEEAGGFLADPQHLRFLNAILGEQIPPVSIVKARFGSVRTLAGTTLALTVDAR